MKKSTGHTPLFSSLRRAMKFARMANRKNTPAADEILDLYNEEQAKRLFSRREFMALGAGAATLGLSGCLPEPSNKPENPKKTSEVAKIAIVGAGIAGLHAAYVLQKAGVQSTVYEGSGRVGGRLFTGMDVVAPGLYAELGGEFVDSGHEDIINLCNEFGLKLNDRLDPKGEGKYKNAYFFEGRHYTEQEVIKAFQPIATRMDVDINKLSESFTYNSFSPDDQRLDRMSIAAYLDSIGVSGWFRKLLDVAWVTEFGRETQEQTALNLLWLISTDTSEGFSIFGESDEQFKIEGGSEQLTRALYKKLQSQIKISHKLEAIRTGKNGGYTLSFASGGGTKDVEAEIVLLTLPFTLLREVDVQVSLPEVKKKAIKELGYGTNAKLYVGFKDRIWHAKNYSGEAFTDEGFQLSWDNSAFQPGPAGGLTLFSGGTSGVAVGDGTPESHVNNFMSGVEKVFPGASAARNGQTARFHWPTYEWAKMSYACYLPGQYTTIAGAEFEPVGNLFFAGEHTSLDYQGYMNGGAETGRRAAEGILEKLGIKKAENA